jgi:hypothetical protein
MQNSIIIILLLSLWANGIIEITRSGGVGVCIQWPPAPPQSVRLCRDSVSSTSIFNLCYL